MTFAAIITLWPQGARRKAVDSFYIGVAPIGQPLEPKLIPDELPGGLLAASGPTRTGEWARRSADDSVIGRRGRHSLYGGSAGT